MNNLDLVEFADKSSTESENPGFPLTQLPVESRPARQHQRQQVIIIIIIYTTYIAPYIWPVWPFIGAEEGPSKY